MSGSETGVMTSTATREPFGGMTPQPVIQNMRLAFSADGSAVYKPVIDSNPTASPSSSSAGGGSMEGGSFGINMNMNMGSEAMKKKRGRPRKYGPDGSMAFALASAPQPINIAHPTAAAAGNFSPPPPSVSAAGSGQATPAVNPPLQSGGSASPTGIKKGRGRPPGSSNKKHPLQALGSAGFGFTPHVIPVKAGEDVSSKIMSFSQHGPRAVCILSANGAISNVTLRQPAMSGGTVTYEGRFEILSLSGSFLPTENGGQRSRTGGLSVSLSGPDGRVLGGGVAGLLMAASPVQVVVASFIYDSRKESKSLNHIESLSGVNKLTPVVGTTRPSSPPSRGTLSESSGGQGSPLNQSTGGCNNNNNNLQGISSMPWRLGSD
ncbi:AT-hook motif nuclear-localized protein 10 [Mercurialis annua]|uniref:AT-hook motif nuclear-localized protein 10 n=1 Tax=Mercurialis annua TaxID=3986 RepID=UPI00215E25B4|nr:AT-hook motif nuclear-localized protein 10 [Mercurialis annua]XP_050229462.1 AT-hook motif nuclear-localized protein 10 [Mercurialis annua]XP_050229469.1 AT-hook motif nuclear-localized protein 10 [Mercurialis annua]